MKRSKLLNRIILNMFILITIWGLTGCAKKSESMEKPYAEMNLQETITLADGAKVDLWNGNNDLIYALQDGTQLLIMNHQTGPENVSVGGTDGYNDLTKEAQVNVLQFYVDKGLIYDVNEELEKAYKAYQDKKDKSQFNPYKLRQEINPTASNETNIYFKLSALLPIDGENNYEYCIGTAFDRKTGKAINNQDLFSCPLEDAISKIFDIAKINDAALREEMLQAFQPENIIFYPEYMEIYFQRGTIPSQENPYILGIDYNEELIQILNDGVIPTSMK